MDVAITTLNEEKEKREFYRGDTDSKLYEMEILYKQTQDRERQLKQDVQLYKSKVSLRLGIQPCARAHTRTAARYRA